MKKLAVMSLLAALALAGCGGGDDEPEAAAPEPTSTSSPAAATTKPADDGCQTPSAALIRRIEGLAPRGSGLKVVKSGAIKSPDFQNVYFVGARFTITGDSKPYEGVWAVNGGLTGDGVLLAIDAFAQDFYDGPDGDKGSADISKGDPSVAKAKDCL